jgi:hypothetical protein
MSHTKDDVSVEIDLDDGLFLRPGDSLSLLGEPLRPAFGEQITARCMATIERVSWPSRVWTRLVGRFSFLSLMED